MTKRAGNSTDVKSLTKRTRETGELYLRRSEVETQIAKVLPHENARMFELLENRQRDSADYLLDETIVYLLRQGKDDNFLVETLYTELNRRIWKLLRRFYKNFDESADFEDFGQKIEMAILKKIFDINSDSADYAQVNFGDFVVAQAKVVWRGQLVKINREKEIFYAEREGDDEDNSSRIENSLKSNDAPTDYTMLLREGLAKLPTHIKIVAELLLDGWQIESKDEGEPTISKKLGVSSRTIRNWLKEARLILADYRGEIRR